MTTIESSIERRVLESFARQKLMTQYGAKPTGIGEGYFEITVLPKDFLLRSSGIFNGGVIAALADTAAGYAAVTMQKEDTYFLTVEFKVNFLRQAKGEKLIAKGKVIKDGRTLTVSQTDIFTQTEATEELVATALVTLIKAKT